MEIYCEKCKKKFDTSNEGYWVSGITFQGMDRHHNPPKEISKFLKEEWIGIMINLCRICHQNLHKKITLILKKYSIKPKSRW